jgi:hypothetical protein
MKFMAALGFLGALALTLPGGSFAQGPDGRCIPQYDSSGAQKAPYC